jgi:PucR C-terminal helix-turn-helix domain/GGDEF-like domain
VVDALGGGIVSVVVAPRGLNVPANDCLIYDYRFPAPIEEKSLVLAIALDPRQSEAQELVKRAAAARAAAIVFKLAGPATQELIEAASEAGITLLGVPAEIAWDQLHSLLRSAVSIARRREAPSAGIPVGDLFALANAVAAMVGGPATIEDPSSRVLAYSSLDEPVDDPRREAIVGRRVPERWVKRLRDQGIFRQLWASKRAIWVKEADELGLRPRLAIAVRAGDEVLGSIWVAESQRPLGPDAEDALRAAAGIAQLHMLRHRATEDLDRWRRGKLLRTILEGGAACDVETAQLGIDPDSAFTVIAFQLHYAGDLDIGPKTERVLDVLTLYFTAFRRRAGCVAMDPVIYAVLPESRPSSPGSLKALAAAAVRRSVEPLGVTLKVGLGSTVRGVRQVPASRAEADQVLRVLSSLPNGPLIAHIDDVRTQTLLIELRDIASVHPRFLAGKVQILVEHDAAKHTAYVDTLRAHLDLFGDISAASASVGVHPNTFRYRLRRLLEISGIDLDDPDERLVAHLQLRFLQHAPPGRLLSAG